MKNRLKKLEERVVYLESAVESLMRELAAVTAELIDGRVLDDEVYCEGCGEKLLSGEGHLWADGVWTCDGCGRPELAEFVDFDSK